MLIFKKIVSKENCFISIEVLTFELGTYFFLEIVLGFHCIIVDLQKRFLPREKAMASSSLEAGRHCTTASLLVCLEDNSHPSYKPIKRLWLYSKKVKQTYAVH